ncbi:MAG TPA: imidazolonepropionase, partial [Euryarchaeota archaeon]|nr:imidazolonepropionase [Euryarchaeota archaeon]
MKIAVVNANLVTMAGTPVRIGSKMDEVEVIPNGAVIIEDGLVVAAGEERELRGELEFCDRTVNADMHLVTPGLVDPHTHLIFGGSRERELVWKLKGMTYQEIAQRGGGILYTMNQTRFASIDDLLKEGIDRANIMLLHGTTTCEAKSGYGLSADSELKCLEAVALLAKNTPVDIVSTFLMAHAFPPEFKNDREGYCRLVKDTAEKVASRGLARYIDVFMDEGYFTKEETRDILQHGLKLGMGGKLHCDELADSDGAQLAGEMGLVSAEHLLLSSEKGLVAMAKKGVSGVLLPGTPFALRMKKYAQARKMIDMGVPVALATDFNPNCWMLSMQNVGDLAVYHMGMTPNEVLTAMTVNAAYAIGLDIKVGRIQPGMQGDLVVWGVKKVEDLS